MKRRFSGLASLTALAAVFLAVPTFAQTNSALSNFKGPFGYDSTKEVTLTGTVSRVLAKPAPGMLMGSHLLIAAPTGSVDVSLGHHMVSGERAISVAQGQNVQVTGVMETLAGRKVFLARTLKVEGQTYTLRAQFGSVTSFGPAKNQASGQNGVQP